MTFGYTTTADEVVAGHDLTGKVVVITGASSGIGLEASRSLARAGATVVMANRNPEKSAAALADVVSSVPGAKVESVELDLTSLASVRAAAAEVLARHPKIDLLINNAGVMATPFERTVDGFELQFGTNHLAHFLFTNLLLRAVVAAAPSRIVNLTSNGHGISDVRWDDPNYETSEYIPWQSYGQSKTANILFTIELERRLGDKGVHVLCVHPGVVGTDLFRYLSEDDKKWLDGRLAKSGLVTKTPQQGASTTLVAALSPQFDDKGGLYLDDCQVSDAAQPYAIDPEAARRLWALSEKMVGETFS
ncbi:MAG: oxidoreductase [Acidimicrobiia bacterium]